METIRIREAAERLGVSHKVVRRLINQGILEAAKARGGHGEEWRVSAASLEAYAATPPEAPPAPAPAPEAAPRPERPPAPAPTLPDPFLLAREEELLADKRFLQEQVSHLASLLGGFLAANATASPRPSVAPQGPDAAPIEADPTGPAGKGEEEEGRGMDHGDTPVRGLDANEPFTYRVTTALQSSLTSLGTGSIRSFEMCSVKVLWGKPVLWRVVAERPDDVASLLSALLAPEAEWDPPAGEVVFLWARDPAGEVVWGAACGPEWFGPAFQDALRQSSVERR